VVECPCCGKGKCGAAGEESETPAAPAKSKKHVTVLVLPLPPPLPLPGPLPVPAPPVGFWTPPVAPPAPIYRIEPAPPPAITVVPPGPVTVYAEPVPPPPAAPAYPAPFQPAARIVPPAPAAAPVTATSPVWRTEAHGTSLSVATEDGSDCLQIHTGGSTSLVCEHSTLKVAGQKAFKATVVGKQVALSNGVVTVRADRVAVGAGNRIILDGNACLEHRPGEARSPEVAKARHIILTLLPQDQFEFTAEGTSALNAPHTAPLTMEAEQLFNFWTGFTR
jgi:hypothetical protein